MVPGEPFFLKPWSRKINAGRPRTQEEDMGRQSNTKEARWTSPPHNKEDEGDLFSLGCGIPSRGLRQRHRDNKEITTPSVLDTAGEQAAAWLPERLHPKRTKQAL